MRDLEMAIEVADTINERMRGEDGAVVMVTYAGGYVGITCGDAIVWDTENHRIPCADCDAAEIFGKEAHGGPCPGDTVEGVVEYVEAQLKELASGILDLAGGVPLPYSSLCVDCGPDVKVDEDGCCVTCGNGAMGAWLRKWTLPASMQDDQAPLPEVRHTERGFGRYEFTDRYGSKCSLQESSLAEEACVWLGVDKAFDNPDLAPNRMHLTQEMAQELVRLLNVFITNGTLTP